MTKEEKLELVKKFLDAKGIEYCLPLKDNPLCHLYAKGHYNIAVHMSNEQDDDFFKKYRNNARPLFIRDEETSDFILEKMNNLIEKANRYRELKKVMMEKKRQGREMNERNWQRHLEKLAEKERRNKPKRKRIRIIHGEPVFNVSRNV